jgi:flagellar hook-associated protein 1 FlgK
VYRVEDAGAALNTADNGLDLLPRNGSFLIRVTDASGTSRVSQIEVDLDGIGADTTLNDLAGLLDGVDGVSASVTADGRLRIQADSGCSFTFSQDSSDVLAALGINTFFAGRDASDIAVNPLLAGAPQLLAAATENLPGDGSNAGRLAALATEASATIGGMSLLDFYGTAVGAVAVAAQAATTAVSAADVIVGSLQAQRESVSGVNLDEEAVMLMKYQRAFQGAARYVAVVDELINELIGLIQ